jgi:hypothetical protein
VQGGVCAWVSRSLVTWEGPICQPPPLTRRTLLKEGWGSGKEQLCQSCAAKPCAHLLFLGTTLGLAQGDIEGRRHQDLG